MAGNDTGTGEMKAHVATYDLLISLLKWGGGVAVALVLIVLWLIA